MMISMIFFRGCADALMTDYLKANRHPIYDRPVFRHNGYQPGADTSGTRRKRTAGNWFSLCGRPTGETAHGASPESGGGGHHPEYNENSVGGCVIGGRDSMNEEQELALLLLRDKLSVDDTEAESMKYISGTQRIVTARKEISACLVPKRLPEYFPFYSSTTSTGGWSLPVDRILSTSSFLLRAIGSEMPAVAGITG